MMESHKVAVKNSQWDRTARKSVIAVGIKEMLDITFSPLISTEREMKLYVKTVRMYKLPHEQAFVVKLFNAHSTIKPIIRASETADILSLPYFSFMLA